MDCQRYVTYDYDDGWEAEVICEDRPYSIEIRRQATEGNTAWWLNTLRHEPAFGPFGYTQMVLSGQYPALVAAIEAGEQAIRSEVSVILERYGPCPRCGSLRVGPASRPGAVLLCWALGCAFLTMVTIGTPLTPIWLSGLLLVATVGCASVAILELLFRPRPHGACASCHYEWRVQ